MLDRLFIRGRVVARNFDEAMEMLREKVESMGYQLKPGRTVRPAPVQPWADVVWWEYNVEILEIT